MGWLKKVFRGVTKIATFGLIKSKNIDRFYDRYGRSSLMAFAAAALMVTGVGAAAGVGLAAAASAGIAAGAGAGIGSAAGGVIGSKIGGDEGLMWGSMIGGVVGGAAGGALAGGSSVISGGTEAATGISGAAANTAPGAVVVGNATAATAGTQGFMGTTLAQTLGAAGGLAGGYGAMTGTSRHLEEEAAKAMRGIKPGQPQAGEGASTGIEVASQETEATDVVGGALSARRNQNAGRRLFGSLMGQGSLGPSGTLGAN